MREPRDRRVFHPGPVGIHECAVMAVSRGAVDQQVTTPVRVDVAKGHGHECVVAVRSPPDWHFLAPCTISIGRAALAAPSSVSIAKKSRDLADFIRANNGPLPTR